MTGSSLMSRMRLFVPNQDNLANRPKRYKARWNYMLATIPTKTSETARWHTPASKPSRWSWLKMMAWRINGGTDRDPHSNDGETNSGTHHRTNRRTFRHARTIRLLLKEESSFLINYIHQFYKSGHPIYSNDLLSFYISIELSNYVRREAPRQQF